jgi:hypothetical protein
MNVNVTEDVHQYGLAIGVDLDEHPTLSDLVLEGFNAPLPEPWEMVHTDDVDAGEVLFYNRVTGVCIAEHPLDRIYRHRVHAELERCSVRHPGAGLNFEDVFGDDVSRSRNNRLLDVEVPGSDTDTAHASHALATHDGTHSRAHSSHHEGETAAAAGESRGPVFRLDLHATAANAHPPPILSSRPSLVAASKALSEAPPAAIPRRHRVAMPPEFLCPITADVMQDPVVTADGFSYERSAIEEWFRKHDTSPCTNNVLFNRSLIPNLTLRNHIREFLATYDIDEGA